MNQTTHHKVIKNKLGVLRLARELGNVSQACKLFGYSRDSFYRFKKWYDEHGEEGLQEISRRKPNYKNRVPREVEDAVVKFATEQPAYGQLRVSNELKKKGIFVSPQGVRYIWLRNNLNTMAKRLKALEEIGSQRRACPDRETAQGTRKPKGSKRGPRWNWNTFSWIPWESGHLLCRQHKRCWKGVSTNIHWHLFKSGVLQVIWPKERPCSRWPAKR